MFPHLKDHPFAVEAFFEQSVVLTFAVPKDDIRQLVPNCLELDTLNNQWAFVAMALVKTKSLRPKGWPSFFGNDFYLIGYRVFVRYTNRAGKRLRGLYILKSETDKRKMEVLGNLFTQYHNSTTDIQYAQSHNITSIQSEKSKFSLAFDNIKTGVSLPIDSPFKDWKEARKYAGPLPFTFSYNHLKNSVLIIEGVRQNWEPKAIEVTHFDINFIRDLPVKHATLANAFVIEKIPYYWKKGIKEILE
jgi:uncharacterized protein YqjF (DUF2071 family)